MAKNIVVFSDGTGQDGGVRPDQRLSNVYKMYRASRVGPDVSIDPSEQVAFYDPGLGTDDDAHGIGRLWRTVGKLLASIAGRGIGYNIVDCYEFVLNYWRPGDRIYVVGFSRGAYTARCVAQVVSLCGVPIHEPGDPSTPFRRFSRSTRLAAERAVHQVYEHGAGHPIAEFEGQRAELARRFRVDHGSDAGGLANAYPYFIGVFDTVAALGAKGWKYWGLVAGFGAAAVAVLAAVAGVAAAIGAPFLPTWAGLSAAAGLLSWYRSWRGSRRSIDGYPDPGDGRLVHHVRWRAENYDRGLSGHVGFARQASAIDEDRADFPRVGWGRDKFVRRSGEGEPPTLVQLFFPGNHSDVGGSYEEAESRLSDVALEWMVDEASSLPHPVLLDRSRLRLWPDHAGMQHSELVLLRDRRLWWMPHWLPAFLRRGWAPGPRKPSGYPLHPSVHARFAEDAVVRADGAGPYRPEAMRGDGRFGPFFGGPDPATPEVMASFATARWRVAGGGAGWSSLGDAAELAALLEAHGVEEAVMVFASPWSEVERDVYGARLALRWAARLAGKAGGGAVAVEMTGGGSQAVDPGLLLPGMGVDAGARLGRAMGQPIVVHVIRGLGAVAIASFGRGASPPGGSPGSGSG